MNDLIFSLNNNNLKLTIIEKKEGFKSIECDVPPTVVSDTKILDINALVKITNELISKLTKKSKSHITISFVAQPQDIYLRFITVQKANGAVETQLIEEAKSKFSDLNLENSYFTFTKIAPFVYQFIGVEKDYLENFIDLAQRLNIEFKGIYPWVMLLPKYLNISDPAIFVAKVNNEQVVALSELNGIFYSGVYENDKTSQELDKLVRELSIYKRNQPISKIYTLNYDNFSPENGFEIFEIDIPNATQANISGFEMNLLLNYLLDVHIDLPESHLNLLHLLPVPVKVKSSVPMVYVGVAAAVVVFSIGVGGFFLVRGRAGNASTTNTALNAESNQSVLSGTSVNNQQSNQNDSTKPTDAEKPELKKDDLKIRVENGSGINGAAGNTQKILEELGYNVIEIDTSNEQRSETLFKFKAAKSNYKDMILNDVKEKMPDAKVEEDLDDKSLYDLQIILGSNIVL